MPDNNKSEKLSKIKEFFTGLKEKFNKKRQLDDSSIETEMFKFMKKKGYTTDKIGEDLAGFNAEFVEYLRSQNYDVDGYEEAKAKNVDASANLETADLEEDQEENFKMPRISGISEKMNQQWGFRIFSDSTAILPGLICYVVEKIEPTNKTPYVTYKPSPRVIVSVHNNGVNGGTVFITYDHKLNHKTDFQQSYQVVSEYEVIYSPLTKSHAQYICGLLNFQSKQTYKQAMIKIQKQKQK